MGPSMLPGAGIRILGRGHASVVIAGVSRDGLIAIKARRIDGKRESLVREGLILDLASRAGVAPKPIYYDDDLIVMEVILGPRLEDVIDEYKTKPWIIIEAMRAARILDVLGVLHLELSRPWRNVIYTGVYDHSRALIVDYESVSRGCGNVLSLLGGLARLQSLSAIVSSSEIRGLAREYRRRCERSVYELIEESIVNEIKRLTS